jgi:hypothetical protein
VTYTGLHRQSPARDRSSPDRIWYPITTDFRCASFAQRRLGEANGLVFGVEAIPQPHDPNAPLVLVRSKLATANATI